MRDGLGAGCDRSLCRLLRRPGEVHGGLESLFAGGLALGLEPAPDLSENRHGNREQAEGFEHEANLPDAEHENLALEGRVLVFRPQADEDIGCLIGPLQLLKEPGVIHGDADLGQMHLQASFPVGQLREASPQRDVNLLNEEPLLLGLVEARCRRREDRDPLLVCDVKLLGRLEEETLILSDVFLRSLPAVERDVQLAKVLAHANSLLRFFAETNDIDLVQLLIDRRDAALLFDGDIEVRKSLVPLDDDVVICTVLGLGDLDHEEDQLLPVRCDLGTGGDCNALGDLQEIGRAGDHGGMEPGQDFPADEHSPVEKLSCLHG